MARLNQMTDSDDELPELSTLLRLPKKKVGNISEKSITKQDENKKSPPEETLQFQGSAVNSGNDDENSIPRRPCLEIPSGKQPPLGPLKPTQLNSLLAPSSGLASRNKTKAFSIGRSIRVSPQRRAKTQVDYSKFASNLSDADSSFSNSNDSFTDLSGFIVHDSASDDDALSYRSPDHSSLRKSTVNFRDEPSRETSLDLGVLPFERKEDKGPINLTSPKEEKMTSKLVCPESPPGFRTPPRLSDPARKYSDPEEPFSRLRLSPPRSKSPYKPKDGSHPVTPPSSPSKSKLQSPSKRNRVPPSPHRPSVDAFWSADVINGWYEQYSPKKILKSPRKDRLHSVDERVNELSPSGSPRRNATNSPAKKNKQAIERKRAFDERKHDLARFFLAEVDQAVGSGQVAALAESTGGIKIIWSKKLSSTAGRANWRKETIRTKTEDCPVSTTTAYRHQASIELAEKVIDDEDRLLNVLAHEYCHLANFMLSGIKTHPHGASFKRWAAKTSAAFAHRGVNVTTKHTYEIAYKYIWACVEETCGLEYKRHSRSINPGRHSCGSCKGKLVQVKPAPRKGNAEGEGKKGGLFRDFVKREHERVRRENPGVGFGEIMVVLGREFRAKKGEAAAAADDEANGVERAEGSIEEQVFESENLDDVARKLNFLNIDG